MSGILKVEVRHLSSRLKVTEIIGVIPEERVLSVEAHWIETLRVVPSSFWLAEDRYATPLAVLKSSRTSALKGSSI